MKKFGLILIVVLCAVAVLGFTGCSDSTETYKCTVNTVGYSMKMTLKLRKDDTFVLTAETTYDLPEGEEMGDEWGDDAYMEFSGTFTKEDDTITLKITSVKSGKTKASAITESNPDIRDMTGIIDGNKIIFEDEDGITTFIKK